MSDTMGINGARFAPYPTAHQRSNPDATFSSSGSCSGTNTVPLATPQEAAARRQAQMMQQHQPRRPMRGRPKTIDAGGFRLPAPLPPPIEGRPIDENKEYADELKLMLLDDDEEMPDDIIESALPIGVPCSSITSDPPTDHLLSEAFRNEYYHPHRGVTSWSKSLQPSLPQITNVVPGPSAGRVTNTLLLPGIDATRHRNRFGRSLMAGQEIGVGVIGSDQNPTEPAMTIANGRVYLTQIANGQHGCDTPSYQFDQIVQAIDKDKLNADLPPLAIEHPARLWNSLIHNLEPEMQPLVKWTYTPAQTAEEEKGWTATMTLALPPTHPAVKEHSLACALPKDKYAKEYLAAASLLQAVKTWTGEPKRLKADATNNTLVKCIADDGLNWISSPALPASDYEMSESSDDDAPLDPVNDEMSPADPTTSAALTSQRVFDTSESTVPQHEPIEQSTDSQIAAPSESFDTDDEVAKREVEEFEERCEEYLEEVPEVEYRWGSIVRYGRQPADDTTPNLHGSTLQIWAGGKCETYYGAPTHVSETVARAALIKELREEYEGPLATWPEGQDQESSLDLCAARSVLGEMMKHQRPKARDWMDWLAVICHLEHWPDPIYEARTTTNCEEIARVRHRGKIYSVPTNLSPSGCQRGLSDVWRAVSKRLVLEYLDLTPDQVPEARQNSDL